MTPVSPSYDFRVWLSVNYQEWIGCWTPITLYVLQQYEVVKTEIYDSVVAHAANGSFDIDGLNLADMPVGFPRLSADCPAGTKSALSNTFSCGKYNHRRSDH